MRVMGTTESAAWHRERSERRAEDARLAEQDSNGLLPTNWPPTQSLAEWQATAAQDAKVAREASAHHALAADALEALAVPGVADLIAEVGEAKMVTTYREDDGIDRFPSDAQRAALATLAKIGAGR